LKDDEDTKDKLKGYFLESHKYDSFEDYVLRDKTTEKTQLRVKTVMKLKKVVKELKKNNIKTKGMEYLKIEEKDDKNVANLKKDFEELKLKLKKANISRSIVMTNSQTKKSRIETLEAEKRRKIEDLKEISIGINEIDQSGTERLEQTMEKFLEESEKSKLLVIEINDSSKAELVEYLKNVIDNSIESFYTKKIEISKTQDQTKVKGKLVNPFDKTEKEVVIIFFKPLKFEVGKDTRIFDIEYFNDDWNYQVIDNLENSCYQENVRYIEESSQTIFNKLKSGQCTDLLTKMFIESIKDMEVRPNFEGYLKDIILPTLQKQVDLCVEGPEDSEFKLEENLVMLSRLDDNPDVTVKAKTKLKVVKILGMKIFNELHIDKMVDWKVHMFQDQFTFENVVSIQECVTGICKNEFKKKLMFMLKYLVEFQGISNILTLQYFPADCNKILEEIFVEKLAELMQKNQ
jgi:hypothetical protein